MKLDTINVGDWFSEAVRRSSSAPSGRWCRSPAISPARPPANGEDRRLIREMVASRGRLRRCAASSGVIGHDEERGGELRAIEFPRIKGGKPFDVTAAWFVDMLEAIGQPAGERLAVKHGGDD